MADAEFEERRLAEIYDQLDSDRSDLDVYLALVDELAAGSIVDIGCGTGTFACLLAQRGMAVVGVDPAAASLEVARRKPAGGQVRWILGDATTVPPLGSDLVTMTGNVAQVFLTDEEWGSTLRAARSALRPGGFLVFEVRDPAREGWRAWTRERSHRRVDLAHSGGLVETWVELVDVKLPYVTFVWTFVFDVDGAVLTSESTLRFRSRQEIADSVRAAGLDLREVRDAPDRPGHELVFIATRRDEPTSSGSMDVR